MSVRTFAVSTVLAFAFIAGSAMGQTTWSGSSSPEDLRYRLDILDAEKVKLGVMMFVCLLWWRICRSRLLVTEI